MSHKLSILLRNPTPLNIAQALRGRLFRHEDAPFTTLRFFKQAIHPARKVFNFIMLQLH